MKGVRSTTVLGSLRDRAFAGLVIAFAATGTFGCNLITGADGLELENDEAAKQETPDPSSTSQGGGAQGGSNGQGGSVAQGGSGAGTIGDGGAGAGPVEEELNVVDGVTVTDLYLYQGVSRPIMEGGQATESGAPIVAGRDALLRVFYSTSGYNGQPVTVRLTVDGSPPIDSQVTLAQQTGSSEGNPQSTINLTIPGDLITSGMQYKLELLQPPAQATGANAAGAFPQGGGLQALPVEQTGTLKIVLVPVAYNADGSGRMPDTSPTQLQAYADLFYAVYPVADVQISVRAQPYAWNSTLSSGGSGWSNLLNSIADLRQNDGASFDTYYYGIFRPTESAQSFCGGGCVAGLGFVGGPADDWSHSAIGLGYVGDMSTETAVHELGHNHGRNHAPCGGASGADGNYPYNGASIGTYGYNLITQELYPPNDFTDFMGYCNPTWTSDYTFGAIFDRLTYVTGASIFTPPAEQNLTWERVMVGEDGGTFMSSLSMPTPPFGTSTTVTVDTVNGPETVTGRFIPYDHLPGGVLFIPPSSGARVASKSLSYMYQGVQVQLSQ